MNDLKQEDKASSKDSKGRQKRPLSRISHSRRNELPYQTDLRKREELKCRKRDENDQADEEEKVSELDDSEIQMGYDRKGNSKEVIFADLQEGSYFGELALKTNDKTRANLRDVRDGRCYTSVWAVQNTHFFYLTDKDFEIVKEEQKRRKEAELLAFLRKAPAFKDLRYKQLKLLQSQFVDEIRTRGSKVYEQGEKVTHLYIIKQGEVAQSLKEYQDKPDYMEIDTKEIFKKPW